MKLDLNKSLKYMLLLTFIPSYAFSSDLLSTKKIAPNDDEILINALLEETKETKTSKTLSYKNISSTNEISIIPNELNIAVIIDNKRKKIVFTVYNQLEYSINLITFNFNLELKHAKRLSSELSLSFLNKSSFQKIEIDAPDLSKDNQIIETKIDELIIIDKEGTRVDDTPKTNIQIKY